MSAFFIRKIEAEIHVSMTGRVILRIAYGLDLRDSKDPYVNVAEKTLHLINEGASFGGVILDLIPFCKQLFVFHHPPCCILTSCRADISTTHALLVSWCGHKEVRGASAIGVRRPPRSCRRSLGRDGESFGEWASRGSSLDLILTLCYLRIVMSPKL